MRPVLTPDEMRAFDAGAVESGVTVESLIGRAGHAVAMAARRRIGQVSGSRIIVVAGPGNNGADGRSAAVVLRRMGATVAVADVAEDGSVDLPRWPRGSSAVLVIDAAFGTGYRIGERRSPFEFPDVGDTPVLAVDIASGVDGSTGIASGAPAAPVETITFVAPKAGNLFGDGLRGGRLTVADLGIESLGLATPTSSVELVEPNDVAVRWPVREPDAHKWRSAVLIVGGSTGMAGAAALAAAGAGRAGAGYVSVGLLDGDGAGRLPLEAVVTPLVHLEPWNVTLGGVAERVGAVAIGPGLAVDDQTRSTAGDFIASISTPLVVDAGAIDVIAADPGLLRARRPRNAPPAIVTPHDGEFERMMGERPGSDRIAAARALAEHLDALVVLKGPTTVVVDRDEAASVRLVNAGDQRLATAGTGDVLSGVISAGLARGLNPFDAAAFGAQLHGDAAMLGHTDGFQAGDLPALLPTVLVRPPT